MIEINIILERLLLILNIITRLVVVKYLEQVRATLCPRTGGSDAASQQCNAS
jgi:hypothetical protein